MDLISIILLIVSIGLILFAGYVTFIEVKSNKIIKPDINLTNYFKNKNNKETKSESNIIEADSDIKDKTKDNTAVIKDSKELHKMFDDILNIVTKVSDEEKCLINEKEEIKDKKETIEEFPIETSSAASLPLVSSENTSLPKKKPSDEQKDNVTIRQFDIYIPSSERDLDFFPACARYDILNCMCYCELQACRCFNDPNSLLSLVRDHFNDIEAAVQNHVSKESYPNIYKLYNNITKVNNSNCILNLKFENNNWKLANN